MRTHPLVLAALLTIAAWGCSISVSSRSSSHMSESASESSESSSESSPDGDDDHAYRDDVRDETVAYLAAGDDFTTFQSALGEVARRHGVVDWEASRTTYVGIGAGLAAADAGAETLARVAALVAGPDAGRRQALRAGYDSALP